MSSPPPKPQQPSEKVMRAAESNNLGGFERILVRRTSKRIFGKAEVSRIYDFEEGIIHEGTDEALLVLPWDKIVSVYLSSTRHYLNGRYTWTGYGATAVLAGGGKLALSGAFLDPAYRDDKKQRTADEFEIYLLMLDAARSASESQLPGTLARLRQGEELAFGDIKISLAGVHTVKGFVPWDTVKDVQVRNGVAQIKQAGKFFPLSRQPVGQIPNLPLFSLLASALRSGQQR
jgi:hypothetical protein